MGTRHCWQIFYILSFYFGCFGPPLILVLLYQHDSQTLTVLAVCGGNSDGTCNSDFVHSFDSFQPIASFLRLRICVSEPWQSSFKMRKCYLSFYLHSIWYDPGGFSLSCNSCDVHVCSDGLLGGIESKGDTLTFLVAFCLLFISWSHVWAQHGSLAQTAGSRPCHV